MWQFAYVVCLSYYSVSDRPIVQDEGVNDSFIHGCSKNVDMEFRPQYKYYEDMKDVRKDKEVLLRLRQSPGVKRRREKAKHVVQPKHVVVKLLPDERTHYNSFAWRLSTKYDMRTDAMSVTVLVCLNEKWCVQKYQLCDSVNLNGRWLTLHYWTTHIHNMKPTIVAKVRGLTIRCSRESVGSTKVRSRKSEKNNFIYVLSNKILNFKQ